MCKKTARSWPTVVQNQAPKLGVLVKVKAKAIQLPDAVAPIRSGAAGYPRTGCLERLM